MTNEHNSTSRFVHKIQLADPFGEDIDLADTVESQADDLNIDPAEDQSNQGTLDSESASGDKPIIKDPSGALNLEGNLNNLGDGEPEGDEGKTIETKESDDDLGTPSFEMASVLKSKGLWSDDFELKKDLSPAQLVQEILDRAEKVAENKATEQNKFLIEELDRVTNAKADELGFSEDQKRLTEMSLLGYSPETITGVGRLKSFAKVQVSNPLEGEDGTVLSEEDLISNQRYMVDAYLRYTAQQLSEEDREKLIKAKESNGELASEADKYQKFFAQEGVKIDNQIQQEKRNRILQAEQAEKAHRKSVKETLEGKTDLRGYPIKVKPEEIISGIFDKTEKYTYKDANGVERTVAVSKYAKKMQELQNNPVNAALLALLVLNDFDLSPFEKIGEKKATENFDDALNRLDKSMTAKGQEMRVVERKKDPNRFDKYVM